MKLVYLALIASSASAAVNVGDACATDTDCDRTTTKMCCGVATKGFVTDAQGAVTAETGPNLSVCNKEPNSEG